MITDLLIADLQKIFSDPSNDLKVEEAKKAIERHLKIGTDHVSVKRSDLEHWLATIRDYRQFQKDAEEDIGWVINTFYNITNNHNPLKLVGKLVMGKVELKEIGIDPERLKNIGAKYAPQATSQLMQPEKK